MNWEPFTFVFYDQQSGKNATYTPDYMVKYTSSGRSKRMLVEVKMLRDYRRTREEFAAKYQAAELWCEMQPDTSFKVATDAWMNEIGLENFRRLDDVRDRAIPDVHLEFLRQEIFNEKRLTLGTIIERTMSNGTPKGLVMPALLKLVHLRVVGFDVRQPLTLETEFDDQALPPTFR